MLRTPDQVVARAQARSRKLVESQTGSTVDDFLADHRYCLALARREGIPAPTAPRRWPAIAAAAGAAVELVR